MALSNAQITKPGPMITKWGNLRAGINARLDGNCPLTQQLVLSGVTTCPGCIVYNDPLVTGCSLKWADGYDVNQTFCLTRKYCDCAPDCGWFFIGEPYTEPILHRYSIGPPGFACDCTVDTFLDPPGWLQAQVFFDRINKKFNISVFVISAVLPFTAGICFFSATVDAMDCKDPIMSIDNDYTGCFTYPADAPLSGVPIPPNSLAYGGTATLTPGGCPAPAGGFSAGFSSGFG